MVLEPRSASNSLLVRAFMWLSAIVGWFALRIAAMHTGSLCILIMHFWKGNEPVNVQFSKDSFWGLIPSRNMTMIRGELYRFSTKMASLERWHRKLLNDIIFVENRCNLPLFTIVSWSKKISYWTFSTWRSLVVFKRFSSFATSGVSLVFWICDPWCLVACTELFLICSAYKDNELMKIFRRRRRLSDQLKQFRTWSQRSQQQYLGISIRYSQHWFQRSNYTFTVFEKTFHKPYI